MKKAKVTFYKCIQDSQDFGSDDEHMVSRVFFTLETNVEKYSDLYVDIKQTVGSSFETGSIEVSPPRGYEGPFNYNKFRDGVEKYYRDLVGSQGSGIHIAGGGNIRMYGNILEKKATIEFEVSSTHSPW